MEIVRVLLIYFCLRDGVASLRLNCEFRLNSEECKVNSLKVLENDDAVTMVVGTHAFRRTNSDVKELWITREVETERVPTNICDFFQNMERMDIYGSSINRITRNVFRNCVKVIKACVLFTSLTTLPEDLFVDLVELKELFLYENKLIALPPNLIAKNTRLTSLSAKNNRLGMIDIELHTQLASVDFRDNACINKRFPEDIKTLTLFSKAVADNCESPMKKSFLSKSKELNETLTEKENEIAKLKGEKEKFERENTAINSNITQLMLVIRNLKEENADRTKEIDAIKQNNTVEISQVFDENLSLRLNISSCRIEILEKMNNIKKLSLENDEFELKLNVSQQDVDSLRGNLTKAADTIGRVQLTMELLEADNVNFNISLEECWQNISTISEINENLSSKVSELEDISVELLICKNSHDGDSIEKIPENCDQSVYYLALVIGFVVILIATVVFMRRNAARTLIKQMVNQQVSMHHLIEK